MAQAPATVLQEVNALYIAMYGRAADSIGLNYWVGQISAQFPGTTGATPLPEPGQPGNAQAVAIENFLGLAFFNAARLPTSNLFKTFIRILVAMPATRVELITGLPSCRD
jgi:hypothetical protein